jgi:hypothetical protein
MHGKGKLTWTSGKIYDGQWENDEKHGEGQLTWPNGKKYNG